MDSSSVSSHRAIVPGPDPLGWLGTIVLGIVGSFVGGFLANLIVLLIWRSIGGRRVTV